MCKYILHVYDTINKFTKTRVACVYPYSANFSHPIAEKRETRSCSHFQQYARLTIHNTYIIYTYHFPTFSIYIYATLTYLQHIRNLIERLHSLHVCLLHFYIIIITITVVVVRLPPPPLLMPPVLRFILPHSFKASASPLKLTFSTTAPMIPSRIFLRAYQRGYLK